MKAPREVLKQLRERAGVTHEECGKALGMTASGYSRYENTKADLNKPVPGHIVDGIYSLLVGRGSPPVQEEELWGISDVKRVGQLLHSRAVSAKTSESPQAQQTGSRLRPMDVRYRIEQGIFVAPEALGKRSYGKAPVLPNPAYAPEEQFAALLADDSGESYDLPEGTYLICVSNEVGHQRRSGLAIVALESKGFLELSVLELPVAGRVLGYVEAIYRPLLRGLSS